jgi:hypothetical protein
LDSSLIERVYDEDKIKEIVISMFDDVVEDGTSKSCFDLNVNRDCWVSCDNYKALFHIQAFNRTTLDLHCYIPRENRSNSKEYGLSVIDWINKNAPEMYKKIITQAPSIYRHISIYVLGLGFKKEGSYKKAFLKNGELWDLNLFGLERVMHERN